MRPDYDGIEFYSADDLSVVWELEKAEPILSSFHSNVVYEDVNSVIELYNVQQLMDTGVILNNWDNALYEQYRSTSKSFNRTIGRFFSTINDDNFIKIESNVCVSYIDDFWELVEKYKVYERISNDVFREYLQLPEATLYAILSRNKIVQQYDTVIAEFMRKYKHTAKILVSKFIEKDESSYNIPKDLKPDEFEVIFSNYIESKNANPNILHLIYNAQSTKECPISDKLRLKARRYYESYWEESRNKKETISTGYEIIVGFAEQDEIVKYENDGSNWKIIYDTKWLKENLDYPTVLNNFIYIFGLFDLHFRYTPVSVKSDVSALEDAFKIEGKKYFHKGHQFEIKDMLSAVQMRAYYDFLLKNNVELENIFKWFFEEYLLKEFNVNGFSMNSSSVTASYLEKIRNIASEQDGVLKQFRMYVEDGEIDRELFEISSGHIVMRDIPSMIPNKYAYSNGNTIQQEMFALFSDQAALSYTEKTKSSFDSLYELLKNKEIALNDFNNYQQRRIQWLVKRNCLIITENGIVKLVQPKILVLKDLFEHDVLCLYKFKEMKPVLDEMVSKGDLVVESTLFSRPEADYLNYKLNRSEFSNGLDLRNKYIHSTNTKNETQQINDYMELIKIMVLIIVKINDEFCHMNPQEEMI